MDNARTKSDPANTEHTNDPRIEAFYELYHTLSPETAGTEKFRRCLEQVYHPDIAFSDPMHRITGMDALEKYFEGLYET